MGDGPRSGGGLTGRMRVRIVAAVVLVLLLSSLVSVVLLRGLLYDRLDDEITADLRQEADEFRLRGGLDAEDGQPYSRDVTATLDAYFSREVPDEGELLLGFVDGRLHAAERAQDAPPPEELGGAIERWLSVQQEETGRLSTGAGEARYVALPLRGAPSDGVFVVANFPAYERGELDDAVRTQVLTQTVALAVASLLGLALAGHVLRPLRDLATTARSISDTDLTRRIPVRAADEASQIAVAFNDMLERIERLVVTQRRFLDDAGHELRAPLTVVRGHVELLELDESPEARARTGALVLGEVDRMHRIVNDLLLLARAEQPDFLRPAPLDLCSFTGDVFTKASALAPRDWRLRLPAATTVLADGQRLTQAVLQLALNACEHTEEGDRIEIGAAVADGTAQLWVADEGPGVAPEDVGRIFERFTRGSRRGDGAGLGLSIVQAIAEAHGGRLLLLMPSPSCGARFELHLPVRR